MIFTTHIVFSVMICLLIGVPVNAGVVLGSLLPDIDHPNSVLGDLCKDFSEFLYKHCGHRGLTHSIYWSIILLSLSFVNRKLLTVFIGYTSHVLLDMFTPYGVKLFHPVNVSFTFFNGPVKTGSKEDKILTVIFLILSFVILFQEELITVVRAWIA